MKFEQLLSLVGTLPAFDLATVAQLSGERRQTVVQQLSRFSRAGKIIALRRGMYALAESYRKQPLQASQLASILYSPSYLSELWALSYYGMIPEAVSVFSSVTTRKPRRFQNAFGEFQYRNVKKSVFFSYGSVEIMGKGVLLATPEKALVDLWYLSPGEWTSERMREMRFSIGDWFDEKQLESLVEKIQKPRLYRALDAWQKMRLDDEEGEEIP